MKNPWVTSTGLSLGLLMRTKKKRKEKVVPEKKKKQHDFELFCVIYSQLLQCELA